MNVIDQKMFRPSWYSAPGETISSIIEERKLSNVEFAHQLGFTAKQATDLLQGRANLTHDVARKLENIIGGSASFWVKRELQYRENIAQCESKEESSSQKFWLKEFPINDMTKFGWITPTTSLTDKVRECLRFFDTPDIETWHKTYRGITEAVAFRTSPSFPSMPGAVAAWLRQGEVESSEINCEPWDVEKFRELLPSIRLLTRKKDPAIFISELTRLCAECGVAVVILRAPKGCRASGATRFLTPNKAMILLSFRHLSDDHFWFSFFHEAGHLVLHNKDAIFLESSDTPLNSEEEDCNRLASELIVPPEFNKELLALRHNSRAIIRFARKIGVAPGLVVGQLQHRDLIKPNRLNYLKRRFTWDN